MSLRHCVQQRIAPVLSRSYATALPRPPPRQQPDVETISETSRPRQYYARPDIRELPQTRKVWPVVLTAALLGVGSWYAFLTFATNQEKISSSVVKQIMRTVREDPDLEQLLGQYIRPQPEWWLNGDPRIHGNIRQLQGNIDLSFRLRGSKGAGTVYFTSIRKEKGGPYTVLRFRVIGEDGTVINVPLPNQSPLVAGPNAPDTA